MNKYAKKYNIVHKSMQSMQQYTKCANFCKGIKYKWTSMEKYTQIQEKYWENTGKISGWYREGTWNVMGKFREITANVKQKYQEWTSKVMGKHQKSIGSVPRKYYGSNKKYQKIMGKYQGLPEYQSAKTHWEETGKILGKFIESFGKVPRK